MLFFGIVYVIFLFFYFDSSIRRGRNVCAAGNAFLYRNLFKFRVMTLCFSFSSFPPMLIRTDLFFFSRFELLK